MGIHADLGRALADAAEGASPVQVLVRSDAPSGVELYGVVTGELSKTHVRVRTDDGLVLPVAKTDLTFLPREAVR